MGGMLGAEYIVYLPVLLILLGLMFTILVDSYIGARNRRIMLLIVALTFSLILQNCLGYLLDTRIVRPFLRTLVGIYGYSVRPVILLLFLYIVGTKRRIWPFWALAGLNALIHLTALFSGVCFSINAANQFTRGPLGYSCHITSGILLAYLVWRTVREYSRVKRSEMWIPIFNALLIVASVAADSVVDYQKLPITFLTISVAGCSLFYYIWLHLQFVREHERAIQAEQRIQIMMTQIQPHFLYNTLSTIQALCTTDPAKAGEITGKFSSYLRQNLSTLEYPGMIAFEKELEHTRTYADIERVRFPNIRVEYRIEDSGFSVPPLSLQPIVENAIRHGVRIREEGLVRVEVRKIGGGHEIVVSDNGVGFDVQTLGQNEGTHIGLKNVQERIMTMCGGSVEVESRLDEGTRVTIRIPESEAGQ